MEAFYATEYEMWIETFVTLRRTGGMDVSRSFYEYRPAAHFLVTDEDAADFLQSQFSNELRPFEAGRCAYGLWLDVKGKVIADSAVLCEGEERFRVLSERCPGERITTHLERHIIADDVEIEPRDPGYAFELSAQGVESLGMELPKLGQCVQVDEGVLFAARDGYYNVVVDSEAARDALHGKLSDAGFTAMTDAERGLSRIAAGIPLVPDEIGDADLPGEGELERDAVSFTKGCYLGQEVVARMHNVGKPQRRLFVVRGKGMLPILPVPLNNTEGKQVGELRTAYPDADGWTGVAILKTRFADTGATLSFESSEVGVIRPLREGDGNA